MLRIFDSSLEALMSHQTSLSQGWYNMACQDLITVAVMWKLGWKWKELETFEETNE